MATFIKASHNGGNFIKPAPIATLVFFLPASPSVRGREVLWLQQTAKEVVRVPSHPAHRHIAAGLEAPHVQPDGHVAELRSLELMNVARIAGPSWVAHHAAVVLQLLGQRKQGQVLAGGCGHAQAARGGVQAADRAPSRSQSPPSC